MKLEIELISKEIIKPASPTPAHLRHYQLSFLDQISPPVYNPLALFYPTDGTEAKLNKVQKSNRLKESLSEVLTHYYPLAGRIKDNLLVECSDEGIPYLQAEVRCQLSDVIDNPEPSELNKLVPFELDDAEELPLGIQFNIFDCGGIVIGLGISHKVGDASSVFTFVKTWAATARGEADILLPQFMSASLFPPLNISGFRPATGITKDNIVAKRFLFTTSSIEALKGKYETSASSEGNPSPSRIEILSVFIWSRFMAACKLQSGPTKVYSMLHAVNLRTRMDPPLPEYSFGNYYRIVFTIPTDFTDPRDHDCYGLVSQVRDSISKIDKDYVKRLQKGSEHLDFLKEQASSFMRGEMVSLNFTSLCRFPLYEADFGWGRPIWVGCPKLTFKNLVVFMDSVSGDGVEALVNLQAEDMLKLQVDEELLLFTDST